MAKVDPMQVGRVLTFSTQLLGESPFSDCPACFCFTNKASRGPVNKHHS
jgi:hypothetical protein